MTKNDHLLLRCPRGAAFLFGTAAARAQDVPPPPSMSKEISDGGGASAAAAKPEKKSAKRKTGKKGGKKLQATGSVEHDHRPEENMTTAPETGFMPAMKPNGDMGFSMKF